MSIKRTKDIEETNEDITVGELISTMFYLKNKVDLLEKENEILKNQLAEQNKLIINVLSKDVKYK